MLSLLRKCIEQNQAESWVEFCWLMENAMAGPIGRLLRRFRVDETEAEDLVQEIFLMLQQDDMRKLRTFQGESAGQLAAWLRRIAINYTLNWLDKRCRRIRREQECISVHCAFAGAASAEQCHLELLDDLKAKLTHQEIVRLEILTGITRPAQPIAERTLRRWRMQLRRRHCAS
ncbi:MAG: hypothetical protein MI861_07670 [Pirellulales bacterium]|nr:hypothetical protein [Pirellulales bacterium]